MARILDMNRLLIAADKRDFSFYNRLTDAERKEFVYSIVMRFANTITGPQAETYLQKVNQRLNLHGDLMWKHPDLAYAMLASCGSGRSYRHEYTKAPKKNADDTILIDFLSVNHPGINQDEADIILAQMDKAAFTQLLRETGLDADQEKKIATAYGKRDSKS